MQKKYISELTLKMNRPDDWTDKDELLLLSYLIQLNVIVSKSDLDFARFEPINKLHYSWFENIHEYMNNLNKKLKDISFNDITLNSFHTGSEYNQYQVNDIQTTEVCDIGGYKLTEEAQKKLDEEKAELKLKEEAKLKAKQELEREFAEEKKKLKEYENMLKNRELQQEAELEASIRLPYAD